MPIRYEYYSKHESEEHMLYADELNTIFNIYSKTNKPHLNFLRAWFKYYANKNILGYIQLYFINKFGGSKEVYSKEVYSGAYKELLEIMPEYNKMYNIKINDTNYSVKRLEEIKNDN